MTSKCPRFRPSTRKREAGVLKKYSTLRIFFVLKSAFLVPGNAVYVWTEGLNGENISVFRNIWILGEEGLKKCWYFSCREKFVNYIGDLGRHKKQLDDVNNQQMEELQVLSKTKIEIITENNFPFPTFFYRPCRK